MRKLTIRKIRVDDPEFAVRCLNFMDYTKFKNIFHVEESKLQEFLALSLLKDIQIDVKPYDEKRLKISLNRNWNWKKK